MYSGKNILRCLLLALFFVCIFNVVQADDTSIPITSPVSAQASPDALPAPSMITEVTLIAGLSHCPLQSCYLPPMLRL